MKLDSLNSKGKFSLNSEKDISYSNAKGGTELMRDMLFKYVPNDILNKFNIISTRVRTLSQDKPNILWIHDTWDDPECSHLFNANLRKRFAKIIFVSDYQFLTFHNNQKISYDESFVIKNAIEPIPKYNKPTNVINLIYHTTPHRGLELLVPIFNKLYEEFGDKIHLDVYSSFKIYGWAERDKQYEELFDKCKTHPGITYHGAVSNDVVRQALQKAHIFAYPSIWPETSCIAALEAMSARCLVVCSSFGALPETTANFGVMYPYTENVNLHANRFYNTLRQSIENYRMEATQNMLNWQKSYVDSFHNWEVRGEKWRTILNGILKKHL